MSEAPVPLFIEKIDSRVPDLKAQTTYAAGIDVSLYIDPEIPQSVTILPHETVIRGTGIKVRPGEGYYIQMTGRSGLAAKHETTLGNCVGIIDFDFSDELKVIIHNHGTKPIKLKHGDRVAQMTVHEHIPTQIIYVNKLPPVESNRKGGLGSTDED